MGGYGSGRERTRQGAETSKSFTIDTLRTALAALARISGSGYVTDSVRWTRAGQQVAAIRYHLWGHADGRRWCELIYSVNGEPITDTIPLATRASNLGQGVIWYWQCPCGKLARVLYFHRRRDRWRCRRCVGIVYKSSRESDSRVSRILAGDLSGYNPPTAHDISGLLVAYKTIERLDSTHAGQGEPWSAARRKAARKRR